VAGDSDRFRARATEYRDLAARAAAREIRDMLVRVADELDEEADLIDKEEPPSRDFPSAG